MGKQPSTSKKSTRSATADRKSKTAASAEQIPATASKPQKSATRRAATSRKKNATPAVASAPALATASNVPQDSIAVRAYFLSQERLKNGQQGDPTQDWIEAERQIREESGTPVNS